MYSDVFSYEALRIQNSSPINTPPLESRKISSWVASDRAEMNIGIGFSDFRGKTSTTGW